MRGRNHHRLLSALAAVALSIAAFGSATVARAETQVPFPRPASIEPNVNFWVDVFTKYSVRDFVIVDKDNIARVYQVFHMPGDGQPGRDDITWANVYLKTKYGDILQRLASGREPSNFEERKVAALFQGEPRSAYREAAENLRVQEGLRERFREGLVRAKYYRPTMERIFTAAGLPPELMILAQVESGFQTRAKSSCGAMGIWQFTRATALQYMKVSRYRDDRLNPVRSTQAAARLLRDNYDTLGSWPLAITAYNYGTGGTARAAGIYGGDYSKMVSRYEGPRFGFAVKNYYAEFLAALQVHQHEDEFFPGIKDDVDVVEATHHYILKKGDTAAGIATMFACSQKVLLAANGVDDEKELHPGSMLVIPDKKSCSDESRPPRVKRVRSSHKGSRSQKARHNGSSKTAKVQKS